MGRQTKVIITDDLTLREIDDESAVQTIRIAFAYADGEGKVQPDTEVAWNAEVSKNTAESMHALIAEHDLVQFMLRMRPMVSLKDAVDSDVVRKWAKETHPELKVSDRGKLPMEVTALYRREVIQKVNTETADKK